MNYGVKIIEQQSTSPMQRQEDEEVKNFKSEGDESIDASEFFSVGFYINRLDIDSQLEQAEIDAIWRNHFSKQKGNVNQ